MSNSILRSLSVATATCLGVAIVAVGSLALAANQTATISPLADAADLPFRVTVRPVDVGSLTLPTLQSYAVAEFDGKWVFFGGRTNGLHGFESAGALNFPVASQNRDVWVVDFAAGQSWHRSLSDAAAGLSAGELAALTNANNEFATVGNRLYLVGGYGETASGTLGTMNTLTAVDLPEMVAWAMGGPGDATSHVRQTSDPALTVTGGALYPLGNRMQLVFGQNFAGGYTPGKNGVYTQQVRSFEIVDDGTTLGIANAAATTPQADFRRRDLNVFPVVRPDGVGGTTQGITVLSGVFTLTDGAWTVPVEIDAAGNPTQADPTAADTFKQGFNGYHAAKLGLYSPTAGAMHEVLFGGISLQYRDPATGDVVTDEAFPFVNDVTAVTVDAAGDYAQRHLGYFPALFDQTGMRLRFGANAEFLVHGNVPAFSNGVINLDLLSGAETSLGYIFGGIVANSPQTRGVAGAMSAASNLVFEVVLTKVPEPASALLVVASACCLAIGRRALQR